MICKCRSTGNYNTSRARVVPKELFVDYGLYLNSFGALVSPKLTQDRLQRRRASNYALKRKRSYTLSAFVKCGLILYFCALKNYPKIIFYKGGACVLFELKKCVNCSNC